MNDNPYESPESPEPQDRTSQPPPVLRLTPEGLFGVMMRALGLWMLLTNIVHLYGFFYAGQQDRVQSLVVLGIYLAPGLICLFAADPLVRLVYRQEKT